MSHGSLHASTVLAFGYRPCRRSSQIWQLYLLAIAGILGCGWEDLTGPRDPAAMTTNEEDQALSEKTSAWFVDVAEQAGVHFIPRNGEPSQHRAILETLGVGVAMFDYDNDGDSDLFVPGGGDFGPGPTVQGLSPALFRNEGNWEFTNVTEDAGLLEASLYSHGCVAGDFDSDGAVDLLVTGFGGLFLYRNNGDGTFSESSQSAGVSCPSWNTSAAWGDMNSDGILDLFVVSYVDWSFENHPFCGSSPERREVCSPGDFGALSDHFFLGNGDGTFRDASASVGLLEGGKGLGVLAADIDIDGDLDYYVTNDTTPNLLYRNDGNGRFEEMGLISGAALSDMAEADGSMGVDLGDFNRDGLPDLWVANYEDQSFALYRNDGDCLFQHVSMLTGISRARGVYVGFGTVFFDFDHDADEDLFAATGHVVYNPRNAPYRQQPLLFENVDCQRFANVADTAGPYMQSVHVGRGVAAGDLDSDGDLDLAVAHTNEPIALLDNRTSNAGNWLRLRLIGTVSHRDAIGTRVRIESAGERQWRQIKGGSSYLSTNDPRLDFGLGAAESVDRIEIDWPSGQRQIVEDLLSNQTLIIIEPDD